ncbi:DUF2461 domain-containing protein [Arthrobacter sp. PAMC25284]|uniref:DUF2461 domain-containing protein n=1 Tax=Arthrobacter sp. PAMC25284 TaxID=2861279 RepID=UPI001C628B46|nr:DUF2461 domain-containing protein [Arthrobacter sp. PAMC25284]QYF89406.1 DUF2461 domain-containing protein [Arthrobacter sp. PAMC25284]
MTPFAGIPDEAFRFYTDLEENNNRDWWLEHKPVYDSAVREPLSLLLAELEPEFGAFKLFRPNRDIRFSPDKSPYKTAQGAVAAVVEGVGYYVQVSADGFMIGGGWHTSGPEQLARYRAAVDAPASGEALRAIVQWITDAGLSIDGEQLKTAPRGFPKDHPRAELLTFKSLYTGSSVGRPEWVSTPDAAREVAKSWQQLRPLMEWFGLHTTA